MANESLFLTFRPPGIAPDVSFSLDDLHKFEATIRELIPGFRVEFKDESKAQEVVAFFARPFNQRYITNFTSTLYPVVWFPSRASYEGSPKDSFTILAHEFVHMMDTKKHGALFRISYLCPQLLGILPFFIYPAIHGMTLWVLATLLGGTLVGLTMARTSVLACWIIMGISMVGTMVYAFLATGLWALLLLLGIALLAPWPSPWRTYWEIRGYTVQIAMAQWMYGSISDDGIDRMVHHFIGPDYYFMSWNKGHIRRNILQAAEAAKNGTLATQAPYDTIYKAAVASGIVHP